MVDKKNMKLNVPGSVASQLAADIAKEQAPTVPAKEEVKKETVPEETPKAEVKEKTKANVKAKANVKKAELKTVFMNLRVKESVKADFEALRKELHYSQSDFFELLVAFAKKEIKKQ